ncbi:MAG: hypothetical protein L0J76_03945, partial [Tetragenococcus halophilus]|nr:hypothetical protein [Tetragenococcus halophilus]
VENLAYTQLKEGPKAMLTAQSQSDKGPCAKLMVRLFDNQSKSYFKKLLFFLSYDMIEIE